MRWREWVLTGVVTLLIGGCAAMPGGASPETKAALAPTGKLRVAFLSPAPLYATQDPATGEFKGLAVDLGRELSRRAGVPFAPTGYANVPALVAGARAGEWDVAFMGINAERASVVDFSAPYMEVEQGYLARAGVPVGTASDVDKAGIRIGVLEKAGADIHLSRTLKNAVLVRASTSAELYALLGAGKADVIAATKAALFAESEKQAGSRVLDGRVLSEPIGMGVPKERPSAAASYVAEFVETAKAQGWVGSAIQRAGLRGVVVAPPK